jgi:hypothetical protein
VNLPLITAERKTLGDNAAAHPWDVYHRGDTRYSLSASITLPEALRGADGPATVTIDRYMLAGKRPTRFEMRSIGGRDWAVASLLITGQHFYEFAKRGLVRVCDAAGEDGKPTTIDPPRDADGVTEEWLDAVSRVDRELLRDFGLAVFRLSKNEVAVVEGKP